MPNEPIEAQVARIDERTAGLSLLVKTMHDENRKRLDQQDAKLDEQNDKLDSLMTAFNMGRGGAVAAAKIGGAILLALGGLAWLIDHIPHWISGK